MVDFQSRDSRPTYGGDEDETAEEAEEGEATEEEAQAGEGEAVGGGTVGDETVSDETVSDDEASDVEPRDEASRSVDEDPVATPDEEVPGASLVAGTNGDESAEPDTAEVTTGAATDLGVAVVTVGDDVTVDTDRAGTAAIDLVEANDYAVATREVIASGYDNVQQTLGGLAVRDDVDAIVTLGGDGVGPEAVTVDAARALFDKELPGFGELFRAHARESIGSGVLHTRTCAGIMDGLPVFCLPGSAEAAQLGLEEIVLPEIDDLVEELRG